MPEEVVSVRLEEEVLKYARQRSKEEKIPKSAVIRKLLALGVEYEKLKRGIELYRDRKVSLGKAAEIAGVPITQMMDWLIRFGVKSNITMEDYRAGLGYARKIMKES
jgi:predicted HTH domain antitoxin